MYSLWLGQIKKDCSNGIVNFRMNDDQGFGPGERHTSRRYTQYDVWVHKGLRFDIYLAPRLRLFQPMRK